MIYSVIFLVNFYLQPLHYQAWIGERVACQVQSQLPTVSSCHEEVMCGEFILTFLYKKNTQTHTTTTTTTTKQVQVSFLFLCRHFEVWRVAVPLELVHTASATRDEQKVYCEQKWRTQMQDKFLERDESGMGMRNSWKVCSGWWKKSVHTNKPQKKSTCLCRLLRWCWEYWARSLCRAVPCRAKHQLRSFCKAVPPVQFQAVMWVCTDIHRGYGEVRLG